MNENNQNKVNFNWNDSDKSKDVSKIIKKRRWPFRRRKKKAVRPIVKVLRGVLAVIAVLVIAAAAMFVYAYRSVPDIDPGTSNIYSNIDLSSIIYDSKGREIDKLYYTEDREIVSIDDIPDDDGFFPLKKIEMLKSLKRAGLVKLFLGFESGVQSQIDRYGKGYKLQEFIIAKSILDELEIEYELGYISIDPLMSLEELHESLLFIKEEGCIPYISSIYKELRVQKGNRSYFRRLRQYEQQNGISLVGDVLFDEQRYDIIGYADNRIATIVSLMKDYIDENYKKYYELRRMTQYDENHSKDNSYSIMEKLRYNDYDLLLGLTRSLMKGKSLSVQREIVDKYRHFRDDVLNVSSGFNGYFDSEDIDFTLIK